MDERARQLLQDFIREKLNGTLENIRTFNIKTLRGDDKFGCPGRYFDCDDTEIMRAIYVVLWGDALPTSKKRVNQRVERRLRMEPTAG